LPEGSKSEAEGGKTIILDASRLIFGRMCSYAAKRLLGGDRVIIFNAEKAVLSGRRQPHVEEVKASLEIGSYRKGPYHPRRPDRIIKRAIRGMLPRRKPKGIEALKRLKVYIGTPEAFKNASIEIPPEADASKLQGPRFVLGELAKEIGWKPLGED
jgi:large subunit ribosomal protein L13